MKNFKKLLFLASISLLFVKSSEVLACARAKILARQETERQNHENLKMNNIKNIINEKKDIFLEKMEGLINVSINRGLDSLEQKIDTVYNKTTYFIDKNAAAIEGQTNESMGYGSYACIVGGVCTTGVVGYYLIKYIKR